MDQPQHVPEFVDDGGRIVKQAIRARIGLAKPTLEYHRDVVRAAGPGTVT